MGKHTTFTGTAATTILGLMLGGAVMMNTDSPGRSPEKITLEQVNQVRSSQGREPLPHLPWCDERGVSMYELRQTSYFEDPEGFAADALAETIAATVASDNDASADL